MTTPASWSCYPCHKQRMCVALFARRLQASISESLRPQGLPTSSTQWGAWAGAGMVGQAPALAAHLARLGLGLLRPQEGLGCPSGHAARGHRFCGCAPMAHSLAARQMHLSDKFAWQSLAVHLARLGLGLLRPQEDLLLWRACRTS